MRTLLLVSFDEAHRDCVFSENHSSDDHDDGDDDDDALHYSNNFKKELPLDSRILSVHVLTVQE
jgi:hypothetical protein